MSVRVIEAPGQIYLPPILAAECHTRGPGDVEYLRADVAARDIASLRSLVAEMAERSDLVMAARSAVLSDPKNDHLLAIELAELRALVARARDAIRKEEA